MQEQQKEFFEEYAKKMKRARNPFRPVETKKFSFAFSMDTLLLGLLIGVMGIVVIFAIGVEIGTQHRKVPVRAARTEIPVPKEAEKSPRFTVQVASFGGTEAAREALEQIKRKGIQEAFLIEGSRQTAVCIGGYETRAEADRALLELKKSFKDAFVRNR